MYKTDSEQPGQREFCARMNAVIKQFAGKTALTDIGRERCSGITYADLCGQITQLSALMAATTMRPADRIAVLAPHASGTVLTLLALAWLGYTAVPLDVSLPEEELQNLLDCADVQAVFAAGPWVERLRDGALPVFEIGGLHRPFRKAGNAPRPVPRVPTCPQVMAILFSSGTTGRMKGVEITWGSIFKACEYMTCYTNLSPGIRFLNVLPSSHIAGYSSVMSCFLTGAETGYLPKTDAEWLSVGFQVYRPTNFIMVPKVYEIIRRKILDTVQRQAPLSLYFRAARAVSGFVRRRTGLRMRWLLFPVLRAALGPDMRILGCGTAPCNRELARFYLDLGIDFVNVYGSTETGFPITATNCKTDRYDIDSAGDIRQFPDIQIRIADPDQNGRGEIRLKSPLLMRGYFREPQLTAESFDEQGYFRTGDLGRIDARHHLHVEGRIKEVILLHNGQKVAPEDVDAFYAAACPQLSLACCGVPTEKHWDEIHLFLVRGSLTPEQIEEYRRVLTARGAESAARYRFAALHVVDRFPLTTVGKLKRGELRKMALAAGTLSPQPSAEEQGDTFAVVKELLRQVLPGAVCFTPDSRLAEDLGMDSLNLMELCSLIQSRFGVDLSCAIRPDFSVADLLALLESPRRAPSPTALPDRYPARKTFLDRALVRGFAAFSRRVWHYTAVNAQVIREGRRYILCPNHESHLDSLWVLSALCAGRSNVDRFCCMAADYLLGHPLLRMGFHALGGIPVDRTGNPLPATNRALQCLQKPDCLFLIHPEGTRTRDGTLGPFKEGAARLALESDTEIVPVCLLGAREIYPPQNALPHLSGGHTIRVVFGQPISPRGKTARALTEEIRSQIVRMQKEGQ